MLFENRLDLQLEFMCTNKQIRPWTLMKSCNCELVFPSSKLAKPFASHVAFASIKKFRPSLGQIFIVFCLIGTIKQLILDFTYMQGQVFFPAACYTLVPKIRYFLIIFLVQELANPFFSKRLTCLCMSCKMKWPISKQDVYKATNFQLRINRFSSYIASRYTFLNSRQRNKYFKLKVTSNAESIFISLLFHSKHPSYYTSNRGKRQ